MTKYSVPTSEKLSLDNQEEFRDFLIKQRELGLSDRNADWFDYLLDKDFWKTYPMWTFSKIDGEIWCFAGVQKHNFPVGIYRVMSRLYVAPKFRKRTSELLGPVQRGVYKADWPAKSAYLFPMQREMASSGRNSMIMTMEHVQRIRPLNVICKFFNKQYNTSFNVVKDKMFKTFPDENNWKAWQVLAWEGNHTPPIEYISVDEWKERFPEATLTSKK